MSDNNPKRRTEAVEEFERQVRAERTYSQSEVIGRWAGPGMTEGVSPVDRRELAAAIQKYLRRHLADATGVLSGVLLRYVRESDCFSCTWIIRWPRWPTMFAWSSPPSMV